MCAAVAFGEPDADAPLRSSAAREADGASVDTTPGFRDACAVVEFASFDVGADILLELKAASDPDSACAAGYIRVAVGALLELCDTGEPAGACPGSSGPCTVAFDAGVRSPPR